MAKWDLSKLPEGRKPLPDEWFAERAQMQERIKELEERLKAATDDAKEADAYSGELETDITKAVSRLDKLIYWLNIDDELWDTFTAMEKADHRHMQSEIQTIKIILTGGKYE